MSREEQQPNIEVIQPEAIEQADRPDDPADRVYSQVMLGEPFAEFARRLACSDSKRCFWTAGARDVVTNVSPPKSPRRSSLVGFAIRVCVWLFLVTSAMFTYFVGPQLEQFLLDRRIEVPGGVVLAFRAAHLVNACFVPFAILVMIDGVGSLVMPKGQVAQNTRRTWSRLMWAVPLLLLAIIVVGAMIGALQVLVNRASR